MFYVFKKMYIILIFVTNEYYYSAIQYGKDMEHIAKLRFEEISGFKVKLCGLFIDQEYPYFAASPGF